MMKYLIFTLVFFSFVFAPTSLELCDIRIQKNGVQKEQLLIFQVEEYDIRGYELGLCANIECSMVSFKKKIKSQGDGLNTYRFYSLAPTHGYGLHAYRGDGTLFAKRIILGYRTNR